MLKTGEQSFQEIYYLEAKIIIVIRQALQRIVQLPIKVLQAF